MLNLFKLLKIHTQSRNINSFVEKNNENQLGQLFIIVNKIHKRLEIKLTDIQVYGS